MTAKIMADPKLNARRIAALQKALADPN